MSAWSLLHAGVVAFLVLQRLGELALARRSLQRSSAETDASVEQDAGYPLMVALHGAWIAGCAVEPLLWPHPPLPMVGAMATLLGAALLLRVWTLRTLGRFWHVRVIRRAAQPVVTHGPYRWIRHPNYLVVIVEIATAPLLLGAYGTALLGSVANAAMLTWRIRREEAYLFTVPGYREAFAGKKRLLPGVF